MSFELQMVVATIVVLIALMFVQGGAAPPSQGQRWGLKSRDITAEPTVLQRRVNQAIYDHLEMTAIFIPLVFVAHLADISNALTVWGSGLFVAGRVIFSGFFLGGMNFLRAITWWVSSIGTIMVLIALFI